MTSDQIKSHVTSVLLNNTSHYWTRSEILDKTNEWIMSFPNQSPLEMAVIETAILSLAFDDNVIDENSGSVKLNMRRYAQSI